MINIHPTLRTRTLEALQNHKKGLSAVEINKLVHTTEARKIISDLRLSHTITDEWEQVKRDGRNIRYKVYKFVEG